MGLELWWRMSWVIQIRTWEQLWFGEWTFCPPHRNLLLTVWGGEGTGILGIPGMHPPSKRSFPSWLVLSESAPWQGFEYKGGKTKPQSWSPEGNPIEDFTLTSVSMRQRIWKPRIEGNLRSPNLPFCLMQESLSQHSFAVHWSVAAWIPLRTKNSLPLNSDDKQWHYMADLLWVRPVISLEKSWSYLMRATTLWELIAPSLYRWGNRLRVLQRKEFRECVLVPCTPCPGCPMGCPVMGSLDCYFLFLGDTWNTLAT